MKKELYFCFVFFLLILASCTNDTGSSSGKNTNWRTGTDGIKINFMADNPPSEVFSNQELSVIVEYSNKGAYDVNNLRVYLMGYDKSILFGSPVQSTNSIAIEGKNQYATQGSQTSYISWKTRVNSPQQVDSFKQDLTATACYHYQTIATPTICVDPKKGSLVSSNSCKFTVQDLGSNQGGPIAVTSVTQKTTDTKVYLEIVFENKGGGTVFSSSSSDNCYNNIDIRDIDTLNWIKVSTPSSSFVCKPEGKLRLTNGKGFAICEGGLSGQSYFVTPLNIVLDYNYRQSISKTISIVNLK